jgi:hypothetical protein
MQAIAYVQNKSTYECREGLPYKTVDNGREGGRVRKAHEISQAARAGDPQRLQRQRRESQVGLGMRPSGDICSRGPVA